MKRTSCKGDVPCAKRAVPMARPPPPPQFANPVYTPWLLKLACLRTSTGADTYFSLLGSELLSSVEEFVFGKSCAELAVKSVCDGCFVRLPGAFMTADRCSGIGRDVTHTDPATGDHVITQIAEPCSHDILVCPTCRCMGWACAWCLAAWTDDCGIAANQERFADAVHRHIKNGQYENMDGHHRTHSRFAKLRAGLEQLIYCAHFPWTSSCSRGHGPNILLFDFGCISQVDPAALHHYMTRTQRRFLFDLDAPRGQQAYRQLTRPWDPRCATHQPPDTCYDCILRMLISNMHIVQYKVDDSLPSDVLDQMCKPCLDALAVLEPSRNQ